MAIETLPFDAARYLQSAEAQTELLSDAFASGDARYIAAALGVVARARGMTQIAREAGVTREALYKALRGRRPEIDDAARRAQRARYPPQRRAGGHRPRRVIWTRGRSRSDDR